MKTILRCLLFLCLGAVLLTGCAQNPAGPTTAAGNIDQGAYATGHSLNEAGPGAWEPGFRITITTPDQVTGLLLRGTLTEGQVYLRLTDAAGAEVWRSDASSGANVLQNLTLQGNLAPGEYSLGVGWEVPVRGTVSIYWVPGEEVRVPGSGLTLMILLPGLGMTLVGLIGFGLVLKRKLGFKAAALGGLAWVFTVALKFAWAIPVNPILYSALQNSLPEPAAGALFNLYVGALTGVFEVGIVWLLGRRYLSSGRRLTWGRALAFGIGFGALEALLLGLLNLAGTLPALFAPTLLPPETFAGLAVYNDPLYGIAPVWERVFVVLLHVAANVLIFYSLVTRKTGYFWLAFVYKTLIDAVAAWGQFGAAYSLGGLWLIEAIVAVFGLLGIWIIRWVERHWPSEAEPVLPQAVPE